MTGRARPLVLNVDDDLANRYAMSRMLLNAGFDVIEAATGEEALKRIQENPAVMLLDVKLPDMSGFEVCQKIKANETQKSIPVLLLSASFTSRNDRIFGLDGGADGYMTKPVEPHELIATVNSLIRVREAEAVSRAQAMEWQSSFDAISDAVCTVDAAGVIQRANRAMVVLLAKSSVEVIGARLAELWEAAGCGGQLPRLDESDTRHDVTTEMRVLDRWYRVAVFPVESGEKGTGAVYTLTDITDRIRSEREMSKQKSEIEGLNARLQRAMAETHHRVKNNLQVIAALVDVQVMGDSKSVPMAELKRLVLHIRTMAAIHDTLTVHLAGDDAAGTSLSVRDALGVLLPMIESTIGVPHIDARIDNVYLPVRQVTALSMLVSETLSNAAKHGSGEIRLQIEEADGEVRLEVSDQGPGFSASFEPRESANTGLELIFSAGRHDLGGEVTFRNNPGGGASVVVTFPGGQRRA